MFWIRLALRFLRLGPIGLFFVAISIAGVGVYLQSELNGLVAQKAVALRAGPPAAVDVWDFDADQHMTPLREAVVRGQAVWDHSYELTLMEGADESYAYMVPITATVSQNQDKIVGVAMFPSQDITYSGMTQDFMTQGFVRNGNIGPVIDYNGKISDLGKWDDIVRDAFADQDLVFIDDLVVIWPYMEGREAAFAPPDPDDFTLFGVLSKVAGAVGLLALLKLAVKPSVTGREQDQLAALPLSDTGSTGVAPQMVRPVQTRVMPRRVIATRIQDPVPVPRRFSFGIRGAFIGLVAIMFLAALGTTIAGVLTQTLAHDVAASVATLQQDHAAQDHAAQGIADLVVPDADPNRHWTDIDVTPVLEWFVAKGILAVEGDTDAILTLAMIIGGLLFVLFVFRIYLTVNKSLQPKTSANIASMGLN